MARIIGIDLGSYSVKIAVFQGAFGRFEIEEYLSMPVPMVDGLPGGQAEQLECLQDLMAGLPSDDRITVGAAFPGEHTSVRLVSLPFADKNQIKQTLGFEVEGQVPFDLDDMVLTHRLLETTPAGSRVMAALTPRDQLGALIAALDENGADPKSMVIDGDILGEFGSEAVEAIIDIGHRRTIATLTKNGKVWCTRAISIGGAHLTEALMKAHQISFAEAETRKHAGSLGHSRSPIAAVAEWEDDQVTQTKPPVAEIQPIHERLVNQDREILNKAFSAIMSIIRTTLINFEDTTGLEINRVLLAGGTANMGGVEHAMSEDLGVEVRRTSVSDIAHAAGQPSRFALAHALANRAAGVSGTDGMELRKGDFKFRGDLANLRTAAKWSVIGVAAIFLLGVLAFSWSVLDYNEQLAEIDAQIAEVVVGVYGDSLTADDISGPEDALTKLQIRTVETMNRIDALGSIVGDTPPVISLLHDLSSAMPKPTDARIDVRELTVTPNSLNLDAETDSYDAAATIEKSIVAHQRFQQGKKSDEKKVRDGIRFSIQVPLNTEQASGSEEG